MRAAALVLLMVLGLALSGCTAQKTKYSRSWMDIFDTVTTVTGYASSEKEFLEKAGEIYGELKRYHQLYDIYQEYEGMVNLCTLNARAGETVKTGPEIIALLKFGQEVCEFSGGRTDITIGALLKIWHEAREKGIAEPENAALPEAESLREAAEHRGFDRILIDEEQGTVCLTDPEMRLDVGALAKGFAAQQVCAGLETGYLISVGGNVYATGPKADGSSWSVGVQAPDGNGLLHALKLSAGAVVTSGDYQRYYEVDGKKYHHIIDPDTLYPAERWQAVTVICPDSGLGDALSTTLFLMSREEGQQLLERFGAEASWMSRDGTMYYSPGYEKQMK